MDDFTELWLFMFVAFLIGLFVGVALMRTSSCECGVDVKELEEFVIEIKDDPHSYMRSFVNFNMTLETAWKSYNDQIWISRSVLDAYADKLCKRVS